MAIDEKKMNILIIGVGYHARRIYVPFFQTHPESAHLAAGVDLTSEENTITAYLEKKQMALPMTYLEESDDYEKVLDALVKKYNITGVIISTEPLAHFKYATWALSRKLHILMDKPVTAEKNVASDPQQALKLIENYLFLKKQYQQVKREGVQFSLMAQRRFHPAYKFMRQKINEVFQKTNCPVTSIQAFHSDGQWRLPTEIVEQDYHPYNQGYGKLSHSGYHIIDIVTWLTEAAESRTKYIADADVFASFTQPGDFNYQLTMQDHAAVLPDFEKYNKYSDSEFIQKTKHFGEIDSFSTINFKSPDNRTMCLASINMAHNGFSQRNWPTADGRDLYKGNGRVRQEQYFIEQGPFQSISLVSYQSKEIKKENDSLYTVGGEHHLEIHVFRNSSLFPQWKTYERFSLKDVADLDYERGHQEDARRDGIFDFINAATGKEPSASDFLDHEMSTRILSAMYLSHIREKRNENPLVKTSSLGGEGYFQKINSILKLVKSPFAL